MVVKTTIRRVRVLELKEKSAAWQRKEGKNKEGGLNEKGRKSYERENPGSDLKAPQPEGGPRKRSFCARMGGVKGPMKDEKGRPTRKALALRKWKCSEALSVKDTKKLNKASALDQSDDPKDQDRAMARRTEVDYKDLLRQINSRKKPNKPAVSKMKEQNELAGKWKIDSSAHKKAQKKSKMRNLAKGNTNPNEKAAAEKKAGGPKLYGEAKVDQGRSDYGKASIRNYRRAGPGHGEPAMFDPENKRGKLIDKRREEHKARRGVKKAKVPAYKVSEGKTFDAWKKAAASALGRKKEEKKAEKAQDAGAKARRMLKRREHAKYVSGCTENVPDEMRD